MFITWFDDIQKEDLDKVGGKGANLGEMYRTGMPVPPGFVVTTAGYRHFVEANRLQAQIMTLVAQATPDDPQSYETVAAQIHDLFMTGTMPEELAEAIRQAYARLEHTTEENPAVAVRSSATAEDLPQASFAGQQETFLNVRGADALLEAVKKCWASLWTARAIAYRERMGIPHESVAMAVVVQAMVPAKVSGVLFTANPTTGARDEIVINASYGLGEAIVAGQVTPDTYVLDRETLQVKEMSLGTKEVMVVAAGEQPTTTQAVPEAQRSAPALSEALLRELATLGLQIEQHFDGVPQDIEWAVTDNHVWILQTRPITNLPPPPLRDVRWDPPWPGTIWMRRQVVEHMPEPLSPLFEELYLQEGLEQGIHQYMELVREVTGIDFKIEEFIQTPFATTVNGYAYTIASLDFSWRIVPPLLRMYTVAMPKLIRHLLPRWKEEGLPAYLATIERWKRVDPTQASDEELLQGIRELAIADATYWFAAAIPLGLARITDAMLDQFLKAVAARDGAAGGPVPTSGPYLRGFSSKAVEAEAELEAIARKIRESETLRERVLQTPASRLLDVLAQHPEGQKILDDLQRYFDRYGHRIYNLDFVEPTQAEDPLPVLLSLKSLVEHPERDVLARQAELARERDALIAHTEKALNPIQRRIFRKLLQWAQTYVPHREEALFYLGAAWPTLRRLALELGRRLTEVGSLERPEDVFYLKTPELKTAIIARSGGQGLPELARLARERRELREARKRLDPPVIIPPDGYLKFGPFRLTMFEPQPPGTTEGPVLKGFAVSPGQVTAPASVIRSPEEFDKMVPDTILVCPTTTPAWTPLFSQAKGLVTDIGGALAHGSIVAREFGIPAVMGTGVATQRIRFGQRIHVDGDAGTVTLLDELGPGDGVVQPALGTQLAAETEATPDGRPKALLALAAGVGVGLILWRRRQDSKNKWLNTD